MQNQQSIPVIGVSNHGNSVQTNASTDDIETGARTWDDSTPELALSEAYHRRHFYGEVFGDGFDCFVLGPDDETEQKELARWPVLHSHGDKS